MMLEGDADGASRAAGERVTCSECREEMDRVLYLGLPMHLCQRCEVLDGFFSWVAVLFPIADPVDGDTFVFLVYRGSYWFALWRWLLGATQ